MSSPVSMNDQREAIAHLRDAFKKRDLTLYLGAGVSVANGLPNWDKLVTAMYFKAISTHLGNFGPAPQYLFAIAKWHLDRTDEPLEITARKIYLHYKNRSDFLADLRKTLYAGFGDNPTLDRDAIRSANSTLDAVARLCEAGLDAEDRGVRSVITYNFDSLLEVALSDRPVQPVFDARQQLERGKLPIYHVHGFITPDPGKGSEEIIFTEDQYHLASQDAYSWSNLVQIKCMSGTVGLMVGLSLSDRNMRRLLNAIMRTPLPSVQYVLLQKPRFIHPTEDDLEDISQNAFDHSKAFEKSGHKNVGGSHDKIWKKHVKDILQAVEQQAQQENERVLKQLGINTIWYEDHASIATMVDSIYSGA